MVFRFRFLDLFIFQISSIIDHYCIMENLKKKGKNKGKLEQYTPKIIKVLGTAAQESNFTGCYKKRA